MRKAYTKFIEQTFKLNPVLIVGSGVSAGAGISGMGKLASYLTESILTDRFNDQEKQMWEQIKTKLTIEKMGLEEVLQNSGESISNTLLREIIQHTWCCISKDEQQLMIDISNNIDSTGFIRYFSKYLNSNTGVIHVITTNYDHLIEWSASKAGWRIWDGFNEGPIGSPLSVQELSERMKNTIKVGKKKWVTITQPHLRIYKPHGSLSWFRSPNGHITKMPGVGMHMLPKLEKIQISPTIVTPGTGKYLETHKEPYNTVFSEMKQVLDRCKALLFLGFGFNDLHIQGSFESILRDDSIPKIILAMELSQNVMQLIENHSIKNFIAVQKAEQGSQIISDKFESFILQEPNHWTFIEHLNQAWGVEDHEATLKSV